ncbi:MAG: hypothetical protein Q4A85_09785 [Kingella sp. (in: b-proteobacteria)]|nr:hypothetical protein [Kingella sp. (in: b-proteobacteria)]
MPTKTVTPSAMVGKPVAHPTLERERNNRQPEKPSRAPTACLQAVHWLETPRQPENG